MLPMYSKKLKCDSSEHIGVGIGTAISQKRLKQEGLKIFI